MERAAAAATLLARIGLDPRRVSGRRLRGLLAGWWARGWCVAGLLHALAHHPDRPTVGRGDVVAGARDPLASIGARLAPWVERVDELPEAVRAVDPAARRAHAQRLAERVAAAETAPARVHVATSSTETRRAALAACRRATTRPPGRARRA